MEQAPADKAALFITWKKKEGGRYEREFQMLKAAVLEKKQECKLLIQTLNQKKGTVDALDTRIMQSTFLTKSKLKISSQNKKQTKFSKVFSDLYVLTLWI